MMWKQIQNFHAIYKKYDLNNIEDSKEMFIVSNSYYYKIESLYCLIIWIVLKL
jgi:hypothetical protein